MKKLILFTISIILFNSCEKPEESLTDESLEKNEVDSLQQDVDEKSTSLYSRYEADNDYSFAGTGDYNRDGHLDYWFVKIANTRTGYIEIHVIDGKANLNTLLFSRASILRTRLTDSYLFKVGDYNRDRRIDLWAINAKNTRTNRLEVHILDGATNFSSWMINRTTPHPKINDYSWVYVKDHNKDGWLDVYIIDFNEHPKDYLTVLNGKVKFNSYLVKRELLPLGY